jgi:hypothetical protein
LSAYAEADDAIHIGSAAGRNAEAPLRIAEQIRSIATHLRAACQDYVDQKTAHELEGVSAKLVEKANALENLFRYVAEAA